MHYIYQIYRSISHIDKDPIIRSHNTVAQIFTMNKISLNDQLHICNWSTPWSLDGISFSIIQELYFNPLHLPLPVVNQ